MSVLGRVVTAKLPEAVVVRMDEIARRIARSKSWIVREAVTQWLNEEQRRDTLTNDAIREFEEGHTVDHDSLRAWVHRTKRDARSNSA